MAAKSNVKDVQNAQVETHTFGAETGKILQLVIHSLYAHKEIFLRELISNASDACDRLRYAAQTDASLLNEGHSFSIQIIPSEDDKTLTIIDNGIGMSKDELIENLGTIASSGTQKFLENLTGDTKKDINLIGQFGVGFYSAYMVADNIEVETKRAGEDSAWLWRSNGEGEYEIEPSTRAKDDATGTRITLFLRDDCLDYASPHRIRHIVGTYSDHIAYPVQLIEGQDEPETINKAAALWMRPKKDITEEQYNEFYRFIAHAGDKPWITLHNKAEGTLEYTSLLFIPSAKPFDLFHPDRATRIKLYVKRVFITDENIDIIPQHLRFVKGVVDSEDLPLNISRETLQHNAVLNKIKKTITKKILNSLKDKATKEPEVYITTFWENFGATLKEGLCESIDVDKELILELCRFKTNKSGDEYISLNQYIERMQENQDKIYYLLGDNLESMRNHPQLEGFNSRDIEVILLHDPVDDFWVSTTNQFQNREFASASRSDINFDTSSSQNEKTDENNADAEKKQTKENKAQDKLLSFMKETLSGKVLDVIISQKLSDSAVCLSAHEGGMDMRLERFLLSQNQLESASLKVLEINPNHPIIQFIHNNLKDAKSKELTELLFDQACIIEGESIKDPSAFSKRMSDFITKAL